MTRRIARVNTPLGQLLTVREIGGQELAQLLGLHPNTVYGWLAGGRPSRRTAPRVAGVLGVPAAELWPDELPTPLARALADRCMSVDELAAQLAVSRRTVARWVAGDAHPGRQRAARLAAVGLPAGPQAPRARVGARSRHPVRRPLLPSQVLDLPRQHDPHWQSRAACATSANPDAWWPEPGQSDLEARMICATCPVVTPCRDQFLADPYKDPSCVIAGARGMTLLAAARRRHEGKKRVA